MRYCRISAVYTLTQLTVGRRMSLLYIYNLHIIYGILSSQRCTRQLSPRWIEIRMLLLYIYNLQIIYLKICISFKAGLEQ